MIRAKQPPEGCAWCVACGVLAGELPNQVTTAAGTVWTGAPTCHACDEKIALNRLSADAEDRLQKRLERRGVPEALAVRIMIIAYVKGRVRV